MIPPPPLRKLSGGKTKVVVSESETNSVKGAFLYHEPISQKQKVYKCDRDTSSIFS